MKGVVNMIYCMPISIYLFINISLFYIHIERHLPRNHISNYMFLLNSHIFHANLTNGIQGSGYTLQLYNDIILFKKLH